MDIDKVLFITQEIAPYLPASPMATYTSELAQGVQESGVEVRTFTPNYGYINERRNQLHEMKRLTGMNFIIDDTDHPLVIKVATLLPARLQVYFIFNEDYFNREITKELEIVTSPHDNDERCIFYVRAVLETVKKLRWMPAVIHCSGWVTALAPLYIKRFYGDDPSFNEAKVVYALHDDDFAQPLDARMAEKLKFDGFTDEDLAPIIGKSATHVDITRLALAHADAVMQCTEHIKPEVARMVEESGLPFLPYQADADNAARVERVLEFYKSL